MQSKNSTHSNKIFRNKIMDKSTTLNLKKFCVYSNIGITEEFFSKFSINKSLRTKAIGIQACSIFEKIQ